MAEPELSPEDMALIAERKAEALALVDEVLKRLLAAGFFRLEGEGRTPINNDGLAPWAQQVIADLCQHVLNLRSMAAFFFVEVTPNKAPRLAKPSGVSTQVHKIVEDALVQALQPPKYFPLDPTVQ